MYQETKMLPEWMVEIPHNLPFRQHFLDSVLPSTGLAFWGCGNAERTGSAPLVEGLVTLQNKPQIRNRLEGQRL